MCLPLSEVRPVRPVWLSGTAFEPLLSVGIRQRRGNAMLPRIQIAPPKLSQLGLSTFRDIWSALDRGFGAVLFFFLSVSFHFLVAGPRVETVQRLRLSYYYRVLRCPAYLLVHAPIHHMRPPGPLARSHQQHMSQAVGTLPICSIYAPGRLVLLISAHAHHVAPPTTQGSSPTEPWWPNTAVSFL